MRQVLCLVGTLLFFAPTASFAAPLAVGDVLIAVHPSSQANSVLAEYTPAGTLVQKWTMPSGADINGVSVDANLTPYAYLGWGSSYVWTVNPSTGISSTFTYAGMSMDQSVANGQLSAYGHFLYATDFNTGGASTAPNGIVRFDLSLNSAQRFFSPIFGNTSADSDFDKAAIGLDGKFYGLRDHGGYQSSDMITADLLTMTPTAVTLPEVANALAVGAAGDYFLLTDHGIDHYDATFHLLKTLGLSRANFNGNFFRDLYLSSNGTLLATVNDGTVIETTTSLTSYTTFATKPLVATNTSIDEASAMIIQTPVPEPASISLFVLASASLLVRQRVRRRADAECRVPCPSGKAGQFHAA